MWRFVSVLVVFFVSLMARAEGDCNREVEQYDCYDLTYNEASIKDKIVEKYLWHLDPEWDGKCEWFASEKTLYDTKHGAVLTVVLLTPEEVEALYEKRLKGRKVRAGNVLFAGNMTYADSRRYYDGCKLGFSTFLKI